MSPVIKENVEQLRRKVPGNVTVIAAAKKQSVEDVARVLEAGICDIGENYVQEARAKKGQLKGAARWHLIGTLQKNKIKKAVELFDMIQTVDSVELASSLEKECARIGKIMPVLFEVNIAREAGKGGLAPDSVMDTIASCLAFPHLTISGLMTMGPQSIHAGDLRPWFARTKQLYDEAGRRFKGAVDWGCLSMGMSDSYQVAITEGATMIRVGTAIFGPREG